MSRNIMLGRGMAVVLLAGCLNQSAPPPRDQEWTDKAVRGAPASAEPGPTELALAVADQDLAVSFDRKLIRRGSLQLEVEDVEAVLGAIDSLAASFGGFVADAQVRENGDGHHRATVVLRIPEHGFAEAVAALRAFGAVRGHAVTSEDVSKAYFDLETRLRVLRDTETRLRELLRTGTGKLSDVLEVERELSRVVGEIERLEGQRRYLDREIAMSAVSLDLYEPQAIVRAGAFHPLREALLDAFTMFIDSVAAMIRITVVLLPWAVVGLVAALGIRRLRRILVARQQA